MKFSLANVHIIGLSPLSQSRDHGLPRLEGESHEDADIRLWREKLTVSPSTGTVIIPQHGMHQALIAAAKYSGKQIPGQGKKTWTAKLTTGIAIFDEIDTRLSPADAQCVTISANADGVRGSGKRVQRRFPIFHEWDARFQIHILDPIITEAVMRDMLELAGMFIGVGRFRPEKGGSNGRFRIGSMAWTDNRQAAA